MKEQQCEHRRGLSCALLDLLPFIREVSKLVAKLLPPTLFLGIQAKVELRMKTNANWKINQNCHLLLNYSLSISFDILSLLATYLSSSLPLKKVMWKYFLRMVFLQCYPSYQHFAAIN